MGADLTDVVLQWIASFLLEGTQHIAYGSELSSIQLVLFGVPQGSVLGLVLCILYTAELFDDVDRHRLYLHMYADDSQVQVCTPAKNATAAVVRLTACIADINDWMTSRLRLNPAKTQIMWLDTSQQLDNQRRAAAVDRGDSRRFSTQPRRHYRQPAVAGCTCCRCLSQWLLPATPTSSSDAVSVS